MTQKEQSCGTLRIRKLNHMARKLAVDVKFHGQANETLVPASIKVDVSDVARNVASMGRLLRAGFDLHFTNHGHTCWMENGGLKTTISEDSPTSEALSLQFGCRSTASAGRNLRKQVSSKCKNSSHRHG